MKKLFLSIALAVTILLPTVANAVSVTTSNVNTIQGSTVQAAADDEVIIIIIIVEK